MVAGIASMTWPAYRRKLNKAGYVKRSNGGYYHKRTGKLIQPDQFREQPDGTFRTNWRYWAEHDYVPPPF